MPNDMTKFNRDDFSDEEWSALENEPDWDFYIVDLSTKETVETLEGVTSQQVSFRIKELMQENPEKRYTFDRILIS